MGCELRKRRRVSGRLRAPQELPPFRLKTLDGKLVASVDLRGRVAVIDFWGVWCASCRESMPYLQKLADKYAKDPEVAVLSLDAWDPPAVAEKWIREKGYTF